MSLFIGALAFIGPDQADAVKIGVLMGSILSAIIGYLILRFAAPQKDIIESTI
jgi:NhaA family Na+:H+ antiporter